MRDSVWVYHQCQNGIFEEEVEVGKSEREYDVANSVVLAGTSEVTK